MGREMEHMCWPKYCVCENGDCVVYISLYIYRQTGKERR